MLLEDYFDFLAAGDVRVKGTRVGIETVLYDYLFRKLTPEAIAERYRTLELDQVYATILYYLRNREAVDKYMRDLIEWSRQQRETQAKSADPLVVSFLKKLEEARSARK